MTGRFWPRIAGRLLLLGMVGVPMAWSVGYSLLYSVGALGLLRSEAADGAAWRAAFSEPGLRRTVVYSIVISASATTLAVVGSLGITLAWPGLAASRLMQAALGTVLATPPMVAGFLVLQWVSPGGFTSRLAYHAGLAETPRDFPVFVQDELSVGLVFSLTAISAPVMILFLLKTWIAARIDRHCALAEALGATRLQARYRVALPMLWRRVRPLAALAFLGNLGAFELPLMLGRQSPEMFSVLIHRRFTHFDPTQRPRAFALAVVYWLLVASVLAVWLRWQRSGSVMLSQAPEKFGARFESCPAERLQLEVSTLDRGPTERLRDGELSRGQR